MSSERHQQPRPHPRRTRAEITAVLALMDGLASTWGDEGVFRRCRDRLRALVTEPGQQSEKDC